MTTTLSSHEEGRLQKARTISAKGDSSTCTSGVRKSGNRCRLRTTELWLADPTPTLSLR